jgi:hypothetical protein
MYLAAIARDDIAERRARVIDMRAAFAADADSVDQLMRNFDKALEHIARSARD